MAQLNRFRDFEKQATVGCWRLEYDKEPYEQKATPELTLTVMQMLARVPFEAERQNADLYDLRATFDDGSAMLFSYKPHDLDRYKKDKTDELSPRRDEVDMRFFSKPFKGLYGSGMRLQTILYTGDFRIEEPATFLGGRKVMGAPGAPESSLPHWKELGDDMENICPIKSPDVIVQWLGKLSGHLDIEAENRRAVSEMREFEELLAEVHLAL